MFYVLIFGLLAVVLVVAGITGMTRRRRTLEADAANKNTGYSHHSDARRRTRNAKRAQSRRDRRKR